MTAPTDKSAHATTDPAVAADSLTRSFRGRVVLDRLTLYVEKSERVALRGPNGVGKTTLLRCLLGTLLPTKGSITVGGQIAGSPAARRLVGASLAQERSFYLRLSGRENLLLFARLRGLAKGEARRNAEELISELDLDEIAARRADRCSTGQLQQLALARALLGRPHVLLLDEPTRSLDVKARQRLWESIGRRPDLTVVFATHLDEDLTHASRVVDLRHT